jgi:hypothetical protein
MFLAQAPLDCMAAPNYMIPVCTADLGYREWYTPEVIRQLRSRFAKVEAWCDCRIPSGYVLDKGTGYDVAQQMTAELGLDGPPWGQCENAHEFDNAYAGGARRMIGQLSPLRQDQKNRIASAEVLLAFELYKNIWPWQTLDYENCNAGVGSTAIGCYASSTEGATYYPVSRYISEGLYRPDYDSVYAVGLHPEDWLNL